MFSYIYNLFSGPQINRDASRRANHAPRNNYTAGIPSSYTLNKMYSPKPISTAGMHKQYIQNFITASSSYYTPKPISTAGMHQQYIQGFLIPTK